MNLEHKRGRGHFLYLYLRDASWLAPIQSLRSEKSFLKHLPAVGSLFLLPDAAWRVVVSVGARRAKRADVRGEVVRVYG